MILCRRVLFTFLKRNTLVCSRASHVIQDNTRDFKHLNINSNNNHCLLSNHLNLYVTKRFKHKKKAPVEEEDEDSDEDEDTKLATGKNDKGKYVTVHTLRADLLIKTILGIARNKADELFYNSKIRINGEKIFKKSAEVNVDDEVDVIHGFKDDNGTLLKVSRFTIISLSNVKEGYKLEIHKDNALIIENYEDPWKP